MTDADAWLQLTTLITDDATVAARVRQAADDPDAHLAAHAEQLAQRGIDDVDGLSPLIALIDALEQAGELAYLDWKEEAGEVVAQLADLPRVRDSGDEIDEAADGDGPDAEPDDGGASVEDVVTAANALLAPAGVAVVMLDEDSDAYPLVAVPADRVDAIVDAAAAVDVSVETFA